MALITPVSIYSNLTVPVGSLTQQNSTVIDLSSVTANTIALNFVITTSTVSVGPNPKLKFRYAFSNATYTASNALNEIGGWNEVSVSIPSAVSVTVDITTSLLSYITGNKFYIYFDQEYIQTAFTLTASVVPVTGNIIPR
jgi:hypothetical protein